MGRVMWSNVTNWVEGAILDGRVREGLEGGDILAEAWRVKDEKEPVIQGLGNSVWAKWAAATWSFQFTSALLNSKYTSQMKMNSHCFAYY